MSRNNISQLFVRNKFHTTFFHSLSAKERALSRSERRQCADCTTEISNFHTPRHTTMKSFLPYTVSCISIVFSLSIALRDVVAQATDGDRASEPATHTRVKASSRSPCSASATTSGSNSGCRRSRPAGPSPAVATTWRPRIGPTTNGVPRGMRDSTAGRVAARGVSPSGSDRIALAM